MAGVRKKQLWHSIMIFGKVLAILDVPPDSSTYKEEAQIFCKSTVQTRYLGFCIGRPVEGFVCIN